MNNLPAPPGYRDILAKAVTDPSFDVDKLERLIALHEAAEQRAANETFNDALAACEAAMETIAFDSSNPQTRSRYASFSQLNSHVRPVYTKHGFGVSWNTEPAPDLMHIRIIGLLSQGMIARRYQIDMPVDTKGSRGQDVMTKTHATMSAYTYGKRALLAGMFNLDVGPGDDDGNAAGKPGSFKRVQPPPRNPVPPSTPEPPPPPPPEAVVQVVDPDTGETSERVTAFTIVMRDQDNFRTWGARLMAALRNYPTSIDEANEFLLRNEDTITTMRTEVPQLHALLLERISDLKQTLA